MIQFPDLHIKLAFLSLERIIFSWKKIYTRVCRKIDETYNHILTHTILPSWPTRRPQSPTAGSRPLGLPTALPRDTRKESKWTFEENNYLKFINHFTWRVMKFSSVFHSSENCIHLSNRDTSYNYSQTLTAVTSASHKEIPNFCFFTSLLSNTILDWGITFAWKEKQKCIFPLFSRAKHFLVCLQEKQITFYPKISQKYQDCPVWKLVPKIIKPWTCPISWTCWENTLFSPDCLLWQRLKISHDFGE